MWDRGKVLASLAAWPSAEAYIFTQSYQSTYSKLPIGAERHPMSIVLLRRSASRKDRPPALPQAIRLGPLEQLRSPPSRTCCKRRRGKGLVWEKSKLVFDVGSEVADLVRR